MTKIVFTNKELAFRSSQFQSNSHSSKKNEPEKKTNETVKMTGQEEENKPGEDVIIQRAHFLGENAQETLCEEVQQKLIIS